MFCVCLFVLFSHSHTVYATDEDVFSDNSGISTFSLGSDDITSDSLLISEHLYNGNWKNFVHTSELVMNNDLYSLYSTNISSTNSTEFIDLFRISRVDGACMFEKGETFNCSLSNLQNYIVVSNSTGSSTKYSFSNSNSIDRVRLAFADINGNRTDCNVEDYSFTIIGDKLTLEINYNSVPFDVYYFHLYYAYDGLLAYNVSSSNFNNSNITVTRYYGFDYSDFNFKTEDKTQGLLGSIIEWIKSIYEGIVNLPSKIASGLKAFFDNIVNAVTNIGNLIKNALVDLGNFLINGIKNLFIPSDEDITNMQQQWNTLLENRFGALYQVIQLIDDYASAFNSQSKGTITFPSVTIPLAGSEFTFGGWEVQVVPSGFDVLFNAIKLITSVLATVFFVNGLKNRFEKLVGGSNDV